MALLRNFDDPMVAVVTGITLPWTKPEAQQWFEWTNWVCRGFTRKQFDLTNFNLLAAGLVGARGQHGYPSSCARTRWTVQMGARLLGTLLQVEAIKEFYRTLARGYRIVYEPAALVWHRHRRTGTRYVGHSTAMVWGYLLGGRARCWWKRN